MENIVVIDMVCGTKTDTSSDYKAEHAGETYYFCSPECRDHFNNGPGEICAIAHDSFLRRP